MWLKYHFSVSAIFSLLNSIESARILAIIPTPAFSHQVLFRPLWKELASRGHELVLLTTDPMNDPSLSNLTEIDLHHAYQIWNIQAVAHRHKYNLMKSLNEMFVMIEKFIELELEHPDVQSLMKNETERFDLVMVEYLFPTMIAFSWRFNCPFIGVVSLDGTNFVHELMGNPTHPVLYPDFQMPFAPPLNFLERVFSTIFDLILTYYEEYLINIIDRRTRQYFGPDLPPFREISKNISMLFVNANPIFHNIRPLGPTTIQIGGGLHIKPPQALPKDIQTFLDKAKEGVVYFSLGTNVKSSSVDSNFRKVILETFRNLPYKVLWKFDDKLDDLPNNTKLIHWGPQQDILSSKSHSNIRLFITQGGLQSIEESIYYHVPIIGMPFYGDQFSNMDIIETKEIGIALDKDALTKETFTQAIVKIMTDPKYKSNARKMAHLLTDQPISGLEKAVWWTEYVIRHKGAQHLRSHATDVPIYQRLLLDVIAFLILVTSFVTFTLYKILICILRTLFAKVNIKLKTS